MPDFKTHLNTLLESFGLDYENFVEIPLNYQAGQQLSTSFTPTCDGFLILHVGCRTYRTFIADTVWGNKKVADVHNYNAEGFGWKIWNDEKLRSEPAQYWLYFNPVK